jgi:hypothetical protein
MIRFHNILKIIILPCSFVERIIKILYSRSLRHRWCKITENRTLEDHSLLVRIIILFFNGSLLGGQWWFLSSILNLNLFLVERIFTFIKIIDISLIYI